MYLSPAGDHMTICASKRERHVKGLFNAFV
uniref:Uncharacterized protein n=1 Tax=Anguilla anguilla TaxID=7936 RepID=A0A0E9VCH7_ANGAN